MTVKRSVKIYKKKPLKLKITYTTAILSSES